jgi:hypothetical protein
MKVPLLVLAITYLPLVSHATQSSDGDIGGQRVLLAPQFEAPSAGVTVDESFTVTLPTEFDRPCISIAGNGATILIARDTLERLRDASTMNQWSTEDERLSLIRGNQSKELLMAAARSLDSFGCNAVKVQALNDAQYLVGALLNAGMASVIDMSSHLRASQVLVRYVGHQGVFGHIIYLLPPARVFLQYQWWVR